MEKIFLLLSLTIAISSSLDYCKFNCGIIPHVGCNHKGIFDSNNCKKWQNVKLVDLSQEEIELIVNEHNIRRSETALGKAIAGVTAAKMGPLKWHAELAKIASFNVLSCLDDHDECRNTQEYPYVGQNIYNCYNSRNLILQNVIKKSIESWYDERKLVDINDIKIMSDDKSDEIGHFTQMVWSDTVYVGCAIAMWNDPKGYYSYTVCNYNVGNIIGKYVFKIGSTASECENGTNKEYPGICSTQNDDKTTESPQGRDENTTQAPQKVASTRQRQYGSTERKFYKKNRS